jgi:hypothetical protein
MFPCAWQASRQSFGNGKVIATKWDYAVMIAQRFGFEQQLEPPMPMPVEMKEAVN